MSDPFLEQPIGAPPLSAPVTVEQIEDNELDRLVGEGVPLEVAEVFTKLDRLGNYWCVPIIADDVGIEKRCPRVENRIPTESEIGEKYGAVKFCLEFEFRPARWKKGIDKKRTPWLQLSDDYEELHRAYKSKQLDRMEESARRDTLLREARMGHRPGSNGFDMKTVIEALPAIVAVIQALRPAPPPPPPPPPDNSAMMLGMFKILEASILAGGNGSTKMMEQMMAMSRQDKEHMMMFLTHNNKAKDETSGQLLDKVFDLVKMTKEVKAAAREITEGEEVETEKPSIVEQLIKGAGVLLENLPAFMPMAVKQQMVDATLPVKYPEAAAVVEQARVDSELRTKAIPGLIQAYGCAQAREAMQAASIPFTEEELVEVCKIVEKPYAPPAG